jgi:AraC-type DNA-binding domain-containing proteins
MSTLTHETIKIQSNIQVYFLTYEDRNVLIENHWHNSLEILLVKSGSIHIQIGQASHYLYAGDSILINSGELHATQSIEFSEIQLLQIPYSLLAEKIPNLEHIYFSYPLKSSALYSEFNQLLNELGHIYQTQDTAYAFLFSSVLYKFLFLLVTHCQQKLSSADILKNDTKRNRLLFIINYVKEHYAETISLSEISALVSLRPEYFCRFFKKYMGISFLAYVNEIRLIHIYTELLNTQNTITHILGKHGFTNYKLFMKIFRQKYHCTPQQFRKQLTSSKTT